MARQRLSWDEEKVAEIMKQADPYTMNQTRQNPPIEKYRTGDPSAWAEDQNKDTPWKNEGRTETGHPAPQREAVVQALKLEDKALKCITIAQRMLPGAEDAQLEDQATDLMFLPEKSIMETLQRQSDLASKIAGMKKDEEEEDEESTAASKCKKDEEDEEATAAKKAPKEEEVEAKKKDEEDEEATAAKKAPKEEEVEAKKKEEEEEVEAKKAPKKEEEVEAAKKKEEEKEEIEAAKKKEEEEEVEAKKKAPKEEEVTASDKDLLDILFDSAEVVPEAPKTGAKKLSGLVKQASGSDPLANLWDTLPDVSSAFK